MLAIIALRGALPSKYKLLKAELQNQYNLGQNLHLDTLTSVTKVLQNYAGTKGASTFSKEGKEGVSFYQSKDRQVKGTSGKLHANIVCRKCNLKEYYHHCPFISEEKEEEVEEEYNLHAEDSDYIIESNSDDDICYFQAICFMTIQIKNNKELL